MEEKDVFSQESFLPRKAILAAEKNEHLVWVTSKGASR